MSNLSSSELEQVKAGLESGVTIPQTLEALKIDARSAEVCEQLFEAYGRDEIQSLIIGNAIPGRDGGS